MATARHRSMVGSIQERTLLDRVYRDPTLVESAVGAAMDPPFPTDPAQRGHGRGLRPAARRRASPGRHRARAAGRHDHQARPARIRRPAQSPAAHAPMSDDASRRLRHARDPRRPGPRSDHRRGHRARSIRPARTPSPKSACTRASTTRARPTRPARRSRRVWPRSTTAATGWPSPAAWPPRTRCCTCSRSGDHVVACDDVYGGTFRLFQRVLERAGLRFTFVDATRHRERRAGASRTARG